MTMARTEVARCVATQAGGHSTSTDHTVSRDSSSLPSIIDGIADVIQWLSAKLGGREQVEAQRQHNRKLIQLAWISQALYSLADPDQVLTAVAEEGQHLLDAGKFAVWLVNPETGKLICQHVIGPQSERLPSQEPSLRATLARWVTCSGENLIAPTSGGQCQDQKRQNTPAWHSVLCVPLRVNGNVVGVLQATENQDHRFGPGDLELLESLAISAATAFHNAQLAGALRQRILELEARNTYLSAFSHTVAHELRNPLSLIIGFAELMEQDLPNMLDEHLQHHLCAILRKGYKMNQLIDELLLLAGACETEVEITPLDMATVVSGALQRLAYMIEQYQCQILLPGSWPSVLGYWPWIEEVWFNYISNAIKYGGNPPCIQLGATTLANGMVQFWVHDNGPGIAPENHARLFSPFTRLDQTGEEGTGLGLFIVRQILEKLGGETGVESQGIPGQGSVFTFTLPNPLCQ